MAYAINPINDLAKQNTNIIQDTKVVGGCLNILVTHLGTPTALLGKNNIVFIEDEPQRPERIETMFMGLIRSGTFNGARAVILGSFSDPNLNKDRFKIVKPILLDRLAALLASNNIDIPLYQTDDFGHGDINDPLPLGASVSIQPGNLSILTIKL